jgi:riboflavin biosynthesis pyrimidine reductase
MSPDSTTHVAQKHRTAQFVFAQRTSTGGSESFRKNSRAMLGSPSEQFMNRDSTPTLANRRGRCGPIRRVIVGHGYAVNLQSCFNTSEDQFTLPASIRSFYGPFGFPEPPPDRPYLTSNFVIGLDGIASFREITGHTGGKEVSRSSEDRWLMDFLRAHHDAQLMGATTMREEPGETAAENPAESGAFREKHSKGWDYGLDDEELSAYRRDVLKLGRPKVIILSGCENMNFSLKVFNSPRVEPWILTTIKGAMCAQPQMDANPPSQPVKIVRAGEGPNVDLVLAMQILRREHGIRTLLCEGGPTVYGQLLQHHLINEDFRTIAFQVLGQSTNPQIERPTTYGKVSFTPGTAPWFRLVSLHYAPPYHTFLRLRYEGPRHFEA